MHRDACFEMGIITRPSGFKGEVSVKIDADNPVEYTELESVFVELPQGLVPFFVDNIIINPKGKARIKFNGVDSEEAALSLKGCSLLLPDDLLPEMDQNGFYFHEITGFKVIDTEDGDIGTLNQVLEGKAQDIFQVMQGKKEILIPVVDEIIVNVDRSKKELLLNVPEGLIDFYLNEA